MWRLDVLNKKTTSKLLKTTFVLFEGFSVFSSFLFASSHPGDERWLPHNRISARRIQGMGFREPADGSTLDGAWMSCIGRRGGGWGLVGWLFDASNLIFIFHFLLQKTNINEQPFVISIRWIFAVLLFCFESLLGGHTCSVLFGVEVFLGGYLFSFVWRCGFGSFFKKLRFEWRCFDHLWEGGLYGLGVRPLARSSTVFSVLFLCLWL